MTSPVVLCPNSDGLLPLSLQRLMERFPHGVKASLTIAEPQLSRLAEASISLLEPLAVSMAFDGQGQLELSFHAVVRSDCLRCRKPVDRRLELSPAVLLFETAQEADSAMMSDPDVDAISTQDQRGVAELVEDEIFLEMGHGFAHAECQATVEAQTNRPNPFQDLAHLLSMKKPS